MQVPTERQARCSVEAITLEVAQGRPLWEDDLRAETWVMKEWTRIIWGSTFQAVGRGESFWRLMRMPSWLEWTKNRTWLRDRRQMTYWYFFDPWKTLLWSTGWKYFRLPSFAQGNSFPLPLSRNSLPLSQKETVIIIFTEPYHASLWPTTQGKAMT